MTAYSHFKIKCDCCGIETLAEITGDKVVIMDRRHGRKHVAVLTPHQILEFMKQAASLTMSLLSFPALSIKRAAGRADSFEKIKCDCCGLETLGELRGDKMVIMDRRHGRKHVAVMSLPEILNKMMLARKTSGRRAPPTD